MLSFMLAAVGYSFGGLMSFILIEAVEVIEEVQKLYNKRTGLFLPKEMLLQIHIIFSMVWPITIPVMLIYGVYSCIKSVISIIPKLMGNFKGISEVITNIIKGKQQ